MNNFVPQSHLLGQKPVIVNVFNYQKPAAGKPSLISFDGVEPCFTSLDIHFTEFLQIKSMFQGPIRLEIFVEFPSQINEHFALEPEILKNYAFTLSNQAADSSGID